MYVCVWYRIHNISCYECVPDRNLRGCGGDGPPGLCQGLHQENHLEVVRRQRPRRISECILVTIGQGVKAYSIWMTLNQLLKRGVQKISSFLCHWSDILLRRPAFFGRSANKRDLKGLKNDFKFNFKDNVFSKIMIHFKV